MAKNTKLILAEGIRLIETEEGQTASADIPAVAPGVVTVHHRSTIEFSEPRSVRRVAVFRDSAGNLHLELEE
jgi:hypothetical protein